MKLNIPNIYQPIELKAYAPEFGEEKILVWVNPTRKLLNEIDKAESQETFTALTELWKKEEGPWTAEEIQELAETAMEKDPEFWIFLLDETVRLINEHRKKKVLNLV